MLPPQSQTALLALQVNHWIRLVTQNKERGKFSYLDEQAMPEPPEVAASARTRGAEQRKPATCHWQSRGFTDDGAYTTVYGPSEYWLRVLRALHLRRGSPLRKLTYWPLDHPPAKVPTPLSVQEILGLFLPGGAKSSIEHIEAALGNWRRLSDPSTSAAANRIGTKVCSKLYWVLPSVALIVMPPSRMTAKY